MKILNLVVIYILFLGNSFAQNNKQSTSEEFYDVFPLAKWNQYNYNFEFSDTTYWVGIFESAQNDSGTISYLIIDSTLLCNKIEWLVERNTNILRRYVYFDLSDTTDTTYWVQQKDNFILTESLIGNHELLANPPKVHYASTDMWQFPALTQTPVYRYRPTSFVLLSIRYWDQQFDSLWFDETRGLFSRKYYLSDCSNHCWYDKTKIDLVGNIVGVRKNVPPLPDNFQLSQNYPNPFNPSTKIKYSIPWQSFVNIKVYDLLGKEVSTLVNEVKPAGNYEVEFNANKLSNGVYFYRLKANDPESSSGLSFVESKKMILIK
ncbi:MAG: T9SS type A sorting domain-containing protein [Ignavibacteriaceae bacterium]|nr:T9SS type A sorting domain-containing protein [Ignavibacteriaceae bacterium]